MSDKTYEAATAEEALEKAAADLGVDPGDVEHEVVEEKRDFWGAGADTVKIKARVRAAEPEAAVEDPEPVSEEPEPAAEEAAAAEDADAEPAAEGPADGEAAEPAEAEAAPDEPDDQTPADPAEEPAVVDEPEAEAEKKPPASEPRGATADGGEDVEPEAISKLLEQIFHDMEFDCSVEIEAQPDGFLATIAGDDKEALLEGNGRCLSALELIANNAFRHKLPRGNKVRVDAGDFRSRRDEELSDLAFQVAHSAKESGRTQETQPLNPYERRLVHLALAEDSAVTTRSRGSGFLKNVQVIPEKRGGRGRRR